MLEGFQRKYLRGLAHPIKPVVQVGQSGLTDAVLRAVADALSDHELIKVRLQRPEDKKSLSEDLAKGSGADLVGLLGHTVILYKRHPKKPKIQIPARPETKKT